MFTFRKPLFLTVYYDLKHLRKKATKVGIKIKLRSFILHVRM